MAKALAQAQAAARHGDVPVGAVLVRDGVIISRGRNKREQAHHATAHAEIVALRAAAKKLGGWNLHDCVLYVTLEPCAMCAGACVNSRIARIVYGAPDAKGGACGSVLNIPDAPLNHHPAVTGGIMQNECAALLSGFFRARRKK